jgi:arylsulfatase
VPSALDKISVLLRVKGEEMSKSDKSKDNSVEGLSRRDFLQAAGIATLAMGSGAMSLTPETAQAKQPSPGKTKPGGPIKPKRYNVLFILTDQERYLPELSGKGHWSGRDRLTKMGTTFENHQVCSMVCTPSRSVIFTGQHIQHTKMFDNRCALPATTRPIRGNGTSMSEFTSIFPRVNPSKWLGTT